MADITPLLNTGDSAHRVDIVIVAEGYTQAERDKFLADAKTFLDNFLGTQNARLNAPFSNYQGFFNATALFFASNQSGTDQPNNNISVDTYFNASQHGSDGRLLYGDSDKVELAVAQALASNAHELTIVLVNTPLYGGAGGSIAWASAGSSAASELALHETGHSFADLQDEYVDAEVAKSFSLSSLSFKNSPHVTDSLSRIPWSDWMGYVDGELGIVGTYEGGYYRATGVWRATKNSKMLSLGVPFNAPEKEAFAHKYYEAIGDYLSVSSRIPGLYTPVTPNNSLFSYSWKYNGQTLASNGASMFDAYANAAYAKGAGLSVTTLDNSGIIRKNIFATQQTETVIVSQPVKQIAELSYLLSSADQNQVLQFGSANNLIELRDFNTSFVYLDGGEGNDVLKFNSNLFGQKNLTISKLSSGTFLLGDQNAPNWALRNVENVQFQDYTVNLAIHSNATTIDKANLATLEELYVAFFNRIPDADGLNYWINQLKAGSTINSISESFYQGAIFYGAQTGYSVNMSSEDFVNLLYRNALGRKDGADTEGLNYWSAQLNNHTQTQGSLARTILGTAHNYKGDATWGWVADLLDNKIKVANTFAVDWGLNYLTPETSITNGMAVAKLVTATDISAALSLIGIPQDQVLFV
ncbi:MAG: DUF4214 domain-containing protein [Burkholderiales bacterium]|nr:DUF4214 domain-containing protein [Burkholderiales bacterium]